MIEYNYFFECLVTVGLRDNISSCSEDGSVQWQGTPNEQLAALVLKALDKPLTSPECLALQKAITPEQWEKYVEVRKAPITAARRQRYTKETDGMRLDADFDYKIGSLEWEAAMEKWREARRKIKKDLPYPGEE